MSGVRSSWLITARNSVFAWFAASASARAWRSDSSSRSRSSACLRSVTSRSETSDRRLVLPCGIHESQLGDDDAARRGGRSRSRWLRRRRAAKPNSWPTSSLAGRPNSRSRGGVGEPDASIGADDDDAVGEPLDDLAQHRPGWSAARRRRSPARRSTAGRACRGRRTSTARSSTPSSVPGGVAREDADDVRGTARRCACPRSSMVYCADRRSRDASRAS